MRILNGDVNVYWYHDELTPTCVRGAAYGSPRSSATLVPDEGDIIRDFYGLYGDPITVRVVWVKQVGDGCVAFEVHVTTVQEQP